MSRSACWLLCLGLMGACEQHGGTPTAAAQPVIDTSKASTPAQGLMQAYIRLQAKLAQDDSVGSKTAFGAVQSAAKEAAPALGPELAKRVDSAAAQGAAAAKLPEARVAFAALSDAFLQWLKVADNPLVQPLIVAHCPMALEGKGSRWLQLGNTLQNPYFGAEMLTCGTLENTLKPGKKL